MEETNLQKEQTTAEISLGHYHHQQKVAFFLSFFDNQKVAHSLYLY